MGSSKYERCITISMLDWVSCFGSGSEIGFRDKLPSEQIPISSEVFGFDEDCESESGVRGDIVKHI